MVGLGFEVLGLGFDAFFQERFGLRGLGARLRHLAVGLRGFGIGFRCIFS